ncbi:MAG: SH3 domain-containing protein [Candidatus Promineifilaceae bacterium]
MARTDYEESVQEREDALLRRRERRLRPEGREPIPWLWLGLGLLVTLLALGAAAGLASMLLAREPLLAGSPAPTIIRLTGPPSAVPSPTPGRSTPTTFPTFTPPPSPDLATPPAEITIGFYAQVANTEGIGVSLRGGPSTDNLRVTLVPEDTVMLVIGGPEEGSGFNWWQIRLDDGTEGWIAADFLTPAPAPA